MPHLLRLALLASAVALAGGCADDSCRDLGGTWTFTAHCESAYVGQTSSFAQDGCFLEVGSPFQGMTGTVKADGALRIQGVVPGGNFVDCQGTSSSTIINLMCTDDCGVSLTR